MGSTLGDGCVCISGISSIKQTYDRVSEQPQRHALQSDAQMMLVQQCVVQFWVQVLPTPIVRDTPATLFLLFVVFGLPVAAENGGSLLVTIGYSE